MDAGSSRAHRNLKNEIRMALGQLDFVVLFNNESGVATYNDGSFVRYGVGKGGSDLLGIVRLHNGIGRFIALEVKTGEAQPTKHQKRFLELVTKMGGVACVVRSVEDAMLAVVHARYPSHGAIGQV